MKNYTWYKKKLDLNSPDAIHQILAYGTLGDITELKNKIGQEKVENFFLNFPVKSYTPAGFNFIKNYILKINKPINEQLYLKDTSRDIGQCSSKPAKKS